MLLRVFGNTSGCVSGGSLSVNGTGRFSDVDDAVLGALARMHVSCIWLTGVIRHATYPAPGVKGMAGSPYAISDYGDVNPYLASDPSRRMDEFSAMVSRVHRAGMGVILDFVPNHVSSSYDGSSGVRFSDEDFYPDRYHDGDWTDTVKLNYSRRPLWEKMRDILLLWCGRGADGFRCDMAELVPIRFWEWCIPQIKAVHPDVVFIAEVYQTDRYREFLHAGFDWLYDKSCFYDTLLGILRDGRSAGTLTGAWQRLGEIQPRMLNFTENHDEPRLASPFVCSDPGRGLAATAASILFNDAPFLLYFGQELGEDGMETAGYSGPDGRTTIYDWWSLPGVSAWLRGVREGDGSRYLDPRRRELLAHYTRLLDLAADEVFRRGGSYDLQWANPRSGGYDPDIHWSFLRSYGNKLYLCAVNFGGGEVSLAVHIPPEAFRCFGFTPKDMTVTIKVQRYEYRDITEYQQALPV